MVDSYSVKTAEVQRLSADMSGHAKNIQSALTDLESKVGALLGSWSGEAQSNYHDAQRKWAKAAAEMQQILTTIGQKTSEMANTYDSGDKRSAARFQ
ncbi:MAG: WXG100 family type VII secretion target [Actinobacteria bacterium]|jgi:WXG100 family type VII secretion target|nr:WXG100 family type VII secretion target [Actinomycetota bacterium]